MNRLGTLLLLVTLLLTALGIFILYESSSYTALLNIGDRYFFVKNQLVWSVIGVVLALIVSRVNHKLLLRLAFPALIGTVILLIVVFFPGIGLELKGAHRWINLGFFVLQPSELLKITLSIYLAAWLSSKKTQNPLQAFLMLFFFCVGLVAMEPDMGSAIIVAITAVTVYFLSGVKIRDMVIIALIIFVGSILLVKIEPYRVARFADFANFNSKNLDTTSYQIKQVLIAFGFGGLTGDGIGNSVQKYAYLPENTTDSIFAIFAEETGFIGSVILIGIFLVQMILGFAIATRAEDQFDRLLALGIVVYLSTQTIVNLASQVVLMPLTGVPLPFISYGGSSMIINYISIGILLNLSRQLYPAKLKKKKVGKSRSFDPLRKTLAR